MIRVRYPEITVLVFPVLESRKTVLRKGCASLRPKAKNCQPFQNTLYVNYRSSPLVEGTDLEDVLSFFGESFNSETLLKG